MMPDVELETINVPLPCGLCGRLTTRYSPELDMPFCGREERPADWSRPDDYAPPMTGGDRRRRRWFGRRR